MRRFGEPVIAGQIYGERLGAYAIIEDGTDLLVTFQSEPAPELQLPGGGLDPGESPVAALHREVFEETGWRIDVVRRLGAFQRYAYMPEYDRWARKVCAIYLARPVLRLGAPSEPAHGTVWLPYPAALELLAVAGDRHFVARRYAAIRLDGLTPGGRARRR